MNKTKKIFVFFLVVIALFSAKGTLIEASEITGGLDNQGVVPIAPSSVVATKTPDVNEITLTWNAVVGVDGYRVYRKKDSGSFILISDNVTALTYKDQGLNDGTYSYQVQSFKGVLNPDLNNILPTTPITIVIPTSTPTPPTPTPTPPPSGGGGGGGGGTNPTPSPTPSPSPTSLSADAEKVDANKDGKIDVMDFNTLMINWGSVAANNPADFNKDGKVDIFDFNLLMINWS